MPEQKSRAKGRKRRTKPLHVFFAVLFVLALFCGIGYAGYSAYLIVTGMHRIADDILAEESTETTTTTTTTTTSPYPLAATRTTETVSLADRTLIFGDTAALIAVHEAGNELLAERNADAVIYPASMTKIMTMLTYLKLMGHSDLPFRVEMDSEILSYAWQNNASCAGFMEFEHVRVIDLLYGTMLPSGADAAMMLAKHASGSEAAFVREMNAYAAEMGLANTHFVNCTGLHDPRHVSTAQDIGIMLSYAIEDPLCRKLMSTAEYVTAPSEHHTGGLRLRSTMFSRMTGNELPDLYGVGLRVIGGKTGYTDEAGQCLATWGEDAAGNIFVTVIAGCPPKEPYQAVDDTLTLHLMSQHVSQPPARYTATETTETAASTETTETTAAAADTFVPADTEPASPPTETTAAAAMP